MLLQAEVGLHKSARLDRLELHEQIQIAAGGVEVVAQCRAEQMHAQHLVAPAGVGDGIEFWLGEGEAHSTNPIWTVWSESGGGVFSDRPRRLFPALAVQLYQLSW